MKDLAVRMSGNIAAYDDGRIESGWNHERKRTRPFADGLRFFVVPFAPRFTITMTKTEETEAEAWRSK